MARVTFGKILYGFTFACLLPILLAVWAAAAARNIALPPFGSGGWASPSRPWASA